MVVAVARHEIAYMAVPKAACSSVKAALAAIDPDVAGGSELLGADPLEIHKIYPTQRFRLHRWAPLRGWFRFTVVRDPVKRLLSVYTDRIAGRRELYNSPNFRDGWSALPLEPEPDFFFQNLAGYMTWSSVVKHHALPQIVFTGPELGRFTRVYTTAELGALGADLSERLGAEVVIPRLNRSGAKLAFDDLAPATQAAVRARLEPEYEHLGGLFRPPW